MFRLADYSRSRWDDTMPVSCHTNTCLSGVPGRPPPTRGTGPGLLTARTCGWSSLRLRPRGTMRRDGDSRCSHGLDYRTGQHNRSQHERPPERWDSDTQKPFEGLSGHSYANKTNNIDMCHHSSTARVVSFSMLQCMDDKCSLDSS